MSSIDQAVRLVKQAVLQDSKANYPEASRCYKEAIRTFYELNRTENRTANLQEFINTRVKQYEERLRTIDSYLLEQTSDLTKLLKSLDIVPGSEESCGSSVTSSTSSTTRQLYKNPHLVVALDSLRRGRKADERLNYRLALSCYENGLTRLLELINKGVLTPRQEERAREKCLMYHERVQLIRANLEEGRFIRERSMDLSCLSLNSGQRSPGPDTDTDQLLLMQEVQSCSSLQGSTQSINQSMDSHNKGEVYTYTVVQREGSHREDSYRKENAYSQENSYDSYYNDEGLGLDKTHDTLHGSLPLLFTGSKDLGVSRSTHSLYPNCEIRRPPTAMSGLSEDVPRYPTLVPLADINQELSLSTGSVNSCGSSTRAFSNRKSFCSGKLVEGLDTVELYTVDTLESELVNLSASSENIKYDDTASDSGYSDRSPDGRDGKSPSSASSSADRKSPYSDISEEITETAAEIIPRVIIQNETQQQSSAPDFPRNYGRQRSVFQNPGKDILTSHVSRDNVAVLSMDSIDAGAAVSSTLSRTRPAVASEVRPEVYTRYPRHEAIPSRATARRPGRVERDGCFYLVAALDFCWCL